MSDGSFWKGKRVLITGINGFIGGNISKSLIGQGAEVFGLIRNINHDSFLYFEGLDSRATLVHGDLLDKELLTRVIVEERIACVFHLAAQVEVGVARAYPFLTWETNIRGTYSLLEAVRQNGENIEAFIMASSDKAYGEYGREKMPYRETYPLIPTYPYDVSKACADMIAQSYAYPLYRLPVIVTRFSNIYGPGQLNFSALIPDAVRCALGYGDFVPRSDGTQVRDYVFVDDAVQLYTLLAERLAKNSDLRGEVFNAGTNDPHSVQEVVRKVFELTEQEEKYAKIEKLWANKKTTGEIDCQYMTFDKVNKLCGWKPETDFDSGIRSTVAWYREYFLARKKQ